MADTVAILLVSLGAAMQYALPVAGAAGCFVYAFGGLDEFDCESSGRTHEMTRGQQWVEGRSASNVEMESLRRRVVLLSDPDYRKLSKMPSLMLSCSDDGSVTMSA
uniref:Uncharacterized protein n=1 Tax=Trieres chinensis TaxID=1514140 RepID=A0A7S2EM88_TRICV|mmetsp:Transcript_30237/g.61651  ORF Transcript_30237/g.61651 Transcript_30237/m.61651 type:complete len:106 (+) Transcript_30237:92-409(+)|eukprot:CAMPEP_0183303434 /NCGR_PEP_ID=MMETSP0160_2-20130417/8877_1 /TAXON_ID=2839 ORGANISM="Odontella Sinensis, Strain Grunow 1884" /NCGR_SAMPLE_ID=MMETSP0160_2 /ASSEMBLY_ACC=CAM_ASM_000250 /LENGTH=105 /DNA_ID=CAMNT_0025466339 /DNA_START=92 /DNA_END=409 /DNA_ORIENTATION=-